MGLSDVIKNAAVTVFNVVDDLLIECFYASTILQDEYDADTGKVTTTATIYTGAEFVFDEFTIREIENDPVLRDMTKASIPSLNLSPTPKIGDFVYAITEGMFYQVEKIGPMDPATALWVLAIKRLDDEPLLLLGDGVYIITSEGQFIKLSE